MFDLDGFLGACRDAGHESEPRLAVREVLRRALAAPSAVGDVLRPQASGFTLLHRDADLTVLHVVWAPHMTIYPHDHRMWVMIGIYAGQEDNAFYRRTARGAATLTPSGGAELTAGDVALLGAETIHAVTNPRDVVTAAIHVYGGDLLAQPRSQWGPGDPVERPYDVAQAQERFAAADAAWAAQVSSARP